MVIDIFAEKLLKLGKNKTLNDYSIFGSIFPEGKELEK